VPSDEPDRLSGAARPGALLAVRMSPADVGRRVSVRHRYDATTLTDVVGTLVGWTGGADGSLVVERRDGARVTVHATDVVAAKVVPPEISAEGMQRVAEAGWPPDERVELGEWTLRATSGVTGRANSVRVGGDPGMPLDSALAVVTAWYAERGLPPILQVPTPSVHDEALERLGWGVARRTMLRTAGTDAAPAVVRSGDLQVSRHTDPSDEFLALTEPDTDHAVLRRILCGPPVRVAVEVRDPAGHVLLGAGRASAASSPVGRWAGVTSIATRPDARRRGVATLVMAELAAWAREEACERAYLQVLAGNDAANALYDRLGFGPHHVYVYRSRTAGAVPGR
jgi:GNAT superfamily N-acetyltransferase